jgi:hypothetical protein
VSLPSGITEWDIRNCGSRSVKQIVAEQVEIQANCTKSARQPDFAGVLRTVRRATTAGFGIGFCAVQSRSTDTWSVETDADRSKSSFQSSQPE